MLKTTEMLTIATLLAALLIQVGCASKPKRIDPDSDRAVVTAGVDYAEILEWAETLTNRMLQSGFLDTGEFGAQPIRMVVSNIENMSNLSNFPNEVMLGRIRAAMLNSGKARYVSTYGSDAIDTMSTDTRDLVNDPRFQNPEWNKQQGALSVARLSLRTQILFVGARDGRARQNTYEVRMFITDAANGEVVWEGFSNPIAKKTTRSSLSF